MMKLLVRLSVSLLCLLLICLSFYSPVHLATEEVNDEGRRLQASVLPMLTQFSSSVNKRIHRGARATQEIINRFNENHTSHHDSHSIAGIGAADDNAQSPLTMLQQEIPPPPLANDQEQSKRISSGASSQPSKGPIDRVVSSKKNENGYLRCSFVESCCNLNSALLTFCFRADRFASRTRPAC